MTIAVGILVEIVLMILLCCIEIPQREFLNSDRLIQQCLLLREHLINNRELVFCDIIDTCAITGALVMPLFVEAHGVNRLEEHVKQELQTDDLFVIRDMYRLRIARLVCIYLLVSRILRLPVSESYLRIDDTLNLLEVMFCAPEASSC